MTDVLRRLADASRPLRVQLGLTRKTVSDAAPEDGRLGLHALRLWLSDIRQPLLRRVGLARGPAPSAALGGEGESPYGLDQRVFTRNLDGEERLKAWQAFTHAFWDHQGPLPSVEDLRFVFRRGFLPERWWTYNLKRANADHYLSDLQGALLYRVNGAYAPVLDNRLLLRRAMAHYYPVPDPWYLLAPDGTGMALSESWTALEKKGSSTARVLVQPVDASCNGRTGVFTLGNGRFEGAGKRGSLQQLIQLVRTWALASGSQYVFSQLVEQGDFARALFPDAINRLHVVMLRNPETWAPELAAVILRVGTKRSAPVDAFEAGGLSAWVAPESGRVLRCLMPQTGAVPKAIDKHPDSGAQITGICIPDWPTFSQRLLDLFEQSSYLRACSFDFILGPTGPVLLDASALPDLGALQAHQPLAEAFRHFRL